MSTQVLSEHLTLVRGIPLFESLAEEELENLMTRAPVRRYRSRTMLMEKGDEAHALYVVISGHVRIFADDGNDKEITLNELVPGEYFGELALLEDEPRCASAVTTVDSQLLMISKADFQHFLVSTPNAAFGMIRDLSRKVRALSRDVERLALRDVYGRLSDVLNERAKEEQGRLITDALTQRDLASLVGSSRETISRIFKELKSGGYIALDGKRIVLNRRLPERW